MAPQRASDRLAQYDLRAHYDAVAASTLHSIVRHLPLIIGLAAITLVMAGLLVSQLPRQYSAEALVSPDLFVHDDKSKRAPLASIEGASLVNSEASFISSPAMVRAVVSRLGLDGDPEFAAPSAGISRGLGWVKGAILPESVVSSPFERAASRVGKRLAVTNNPRSYLISVSFTCSSPEKAANIANAFALEYLMQRLTDALTTARRIYGERHPSVVRAKAELEAARIRLQGAISRAQVATGEIALGGVVTLAEPNPTPTSPRGLVILGVALASALTLGIGCAIRLDRQQASVGELGSEGNKASTRTNEI
jgi:uncharacterized protein involved in exopolysaccharide biosynthesis